MYYRHDLDYVYPERCDEHMITVNKKREIKYDENYPYLKKGFFFAIARGVFFVLLYIVVFPLLRLVLGLRIEGRKNVRRNRKLFKNGLITVSNHVFMWDFLCVMRAIHPRLARFPAWKENLDGNLRWLIRWAGGIPIPTESFRAMAKCNRAIEEVLEKGKTLHFFPEGSMWFYYPDIRPFKLAVFKYAVKYDKPVLPISLSFRPRRGLYKLFGKSPCVDMHIGEPLLIDKSLTKLAAAEDLRARAYHVIQGMNGIHPGDPTYNTDQSLDNYQKTM
ncbi:MAG: 1-acyl-sn-glycerol-3-phosphate acyltransferase [Ruminococcaceae bacterium]|nr:1-acyl-sn-glycerol-3-phosphate acyltransferase [Oscillospiraceae bacterium]